MQTESFWEATTPNRPDFPSLDGDMEVDVAIIGGGITGISTALQLTAAGKRVAVIEARRIGGGTTGWNTGNLYVPVGPAYHHLALTRGKETALQVVQARDAALDFIEQQVNEKVIDCHFARRPWYYFSYEDDMADEIEKEVELLQEAGMPVKLVDEVPPLHRQHLKRAACMAGKAARIHPLRYVLALATDLADRGCLIFEKTKALDFKEESDRCLVKTNRGTVTAGQVVIATHIPVGIHPVQTVTPAYRSYVVAMKLKSGQYPDAYFWQNDKLHKAITTHSSGSMELDTLMVAGNHHKTGQASEQEYQHYFDELEAYARKAFDVAEVTYRWSAQHYRSGDGVPYIGLSHKDSRRTYLATGYFADGLIYGTVAGILLSDMILGRENKWLPAFDSTRSTNLATALHFVKANANVAAQYLKDLPGMAQTYEVKDIQPGEGKIVEMEAEKLAVFRDEDNALHICSAVCTHMKCIVNWNNAEKTWDCPCHGSRFMTDGSVIEGPAIEGLTQKKIDAETGKLIPGKGQSDDYPHYHNPFT